eukprot:c17940_g1_i1 orf=158-793(+)
MPFGRRGRAHTTDMADFAQRSILSLFSASSTGKSEKIQRGHTSSVSLVEFLDRKLGMSAGGRKLSKRESDTEAGTNFTNCLDCNGRVSDSLKSQRASLKRRHTDETSGRLTNKQSRKRTDSMRNYASTEGLIQQVHPARHLLILGGNAENHQSCKGKAYVCDQRQPFFNHYTDGHGWWDTDRVGLDSEGVGTVGEWEGVGTTSLGVIGQTL